MCLCVCLCVVCVMGVVYCIKGRIKQNDEEVVVRVAGHSSPFQREINIKSALLESLEGKKIRKRQ